MSPVGLANTRISTDYECPKISPITGVAYLRLFVITLL